MAPEDDNMAWEIHIAVDVTGQEAVFRMGLAVGMEDTGGPVVAPAVEHCWHFEGVALRDFAPEMQCWEPGC